MHFIITYYYYYFDWKAMFVFLSSFPVFSSITDYMAHLFLVMAWCRRWRLMALLGYNGLSYSSSPSAPFLRQWIGLTLIQIMTCRHTAPSHYLNQWWVIVNWTLRNKLQWIFFFIKIRIISSTKMHMKISSAKMRSFCPGGDELMNVECKI